MYLDGHMLFKNLIGLVPSLLLVNVLVSGLATVPEQATMTTTFTEIDPSMLLLGAGTKWAARNGSSALYINWFDNLMAYPNGLFLDQYVGYLPIRDFTAYILESFGLSVSFAGSIPSDLSEYDVVVIDSYWACEPGNERVIRNYLSAGGGLVLIAAVPRYFAVYCKDMWPGHELDPVQEWFGASWYGNSGGSATIAIDNPVGTPMLRGESLGFFAGYSQAAVTGLHEDSTLLAGWETGEAFSFTHEFGQGRVFYQATYHAPSPLTADFTWAPFIINVGEIATFDASLSRPKWNGTHEFPIIEYCWDFGDGNVTSSSNSIASHNYTSLGVFNVTLTVIDTEGSNASCSYFVQTIAPVFLSISTSTTSTITGFAVDINGSLCDSYGNGLANETIVLYYTFTGVNTWLPITSDTTDSLGNYYVQWIPTATGTFMIKAEWNGSFAHLGTAATITLSSISYMGQYVFTVESNSTISNLEFNSSISELKFIAAGPSATKGYIKVTIAKTLVENAANVVVYLDGDLIEHSIVSFDDSWLVFSSFTHSTHKVAISIGNLIPEIAHYFFLTIFMILTLLTVMIYRTKERLS